MKTEAVFFTKDGMAEIRRIDIAGPGIGEVQARTVINGICMYEVWQFSRTKIDVPFIPGHEGIGVVTEVGPSVPDIQVGDWITTCGWSRLSNQKRGDFIRLTCVPEHPESFLPEPLACAVIAQSGVPSYPGDRVILFGAGYMGLLLVQLLSRTPQSHLTVVDLKPENLRLAREFGADEIVDLSDPTSTEQLAAMDGSFDLAFECSGAVASLERSLTHTRRGGSVCFFAWHHQHRSIDMNLCHEKGLRLFNATPGMVVDEKRFRCFEASERLLSAGRIDQRKLVTNVYDVADIQKAMEDSVERKGGFIKSVLRF